MYRALYRKWRPQNFEDVVGQQAIVTALKNQIETGRIGHAYLFTGTRGTGKTTCARIFAKAINCENPNHGDPCCQCEICKGIDNGSILDVEEIDAASNNGVDDIRDLRDETAYTPTMGRYKVYIIDEVHMLSTSAFNALLKILEEPPAHVVFILATTEIHKVLPTILSRCQRYDFGRILPEDIAGRIEYVAGEEKIDLTPQAAALIARLADGALRDALSILDTCAGVAQHIDEDVVRRMAGVTDKSYLFQISDGISRGEVSQVLAQVAQLRQRSVDVKRLCEELIQHYRNLMLAPISGGEKLLAGIPPEEEAQYLEKGKAMGYQAAVQAIMGLGAALERMGKGTDPRIELEMALIKLAMPTQAQPQQTVAFTPAPYAPAAAQPNLEPYLPSGNVAPAPQPVQPVIEPKPQPQVKEAAQPQKEEPVPQREAPPRKKLEKPVPFEQWDAVLERLKTQDHGCYSFLKGSKGYCDGPRILFECNEFGREFLRESKRSQATLKKIIQEITGVAYGIGPYAPSGAQEKKQSQSEIIQNSLERMKNTGLEVLDEE